MSHEESTNDRLREERETLDASRQRIRDEAEGTGETDDQGSQDRKRHDGD